jgi:hypothetical protein
MPIRRLHRWICAATAVTSMLLANHASATGSFLRGCAFRDRQILMMVEAHNAGRAMAGPQLADVIFAIMHARTVCFEGRVLDALALYDGIGESLASAGSPLGRSRPDHGGEGRRGEGPYDVR